MFINYALIAGLLMYVFMIRLFNSVEIKPPKAAAAVMVGFVGLNLLTRGAMLVIQGFSPWQLIEPVLVITVLAQYAAMMLVFYKIQDSGDSYEAYFGWAIAGFGVIFYLIPYLVGLMFR